MEVDTEPHAVEQIVEEAVNEQVEQQEHVDQSEGHDNDVDSDIDQDEVREDKQVPLSALQKERKKRQEVEAREQRASIELQFYKEQQQKQNAPAAPEDDEDQYESVTKREHSKSLSQTRGEIMRDVEERIWIKANPDKAEFINENLANFLKKKPNLTNAIADSSNRYEEAYLLINALSPKQQAQLRPSVQKKVTPGSPNSIPKGASLSQVTDVMSMSDKEYQDWRNSKRVRR